MVAENPQPGVTDRLGRLFAVNGNGAGPPRPVLLIRELASAAALRAIIGRIRADPIAVFVHFGLR